MWVVGIPVPTSLRATLRNTRGKPLTRLERSTGERDEGRARRAYPRVLQELEAAEKPQRLLKVCPSKPGLPAAAPVSCGGAALQPCRHSLPKPPPLDLISFLNALPDCRMRRGVRFPQWWMLLVAILAILSNEGSLVGIERFARRHRQVLNELLGMDVGSGRRRRGS
jgi:hypothetical protein